ncbi:MAG: D-alanine--D-alanine ligase [Polyangiaceae bacterium]
MTEPRSRVAVIVGGPGCEANVSRTSGAAVAEALVERGFECQCIELGQDTVRELQAQGAEVAFPVSHGPVGEDGCLQGLLEVLDLPYVGSAVLASALAAHKPAAKRLFKIAELPLAPDALVTDSADLAQQAEGLRARLGAELVVKPASGGSAIATTRVTATDPLTTLVAALSEALAVDEAALVEALIPGEEVTCGVLERDAEARALPPTLIESRAASWYDFESRYAAGGSVHRCPAPFPPGLSERIQSVALAAHRTLGCRDLSRADFIVDPDTDTVTLLEVNTLPGMTSTSLYPEAAAADGIAFGELCELLVRRALSRGRRMQRQALAMP